MKTVVSAAIIAINLLLFVSAVFADNVVSAPAGGIVPSNGIVDDADSGWTWSAMTPYSDPGLSGGSGRAGGAGGYGVYTFNGTGVDVYAMRATTIDVDGRVHRVGKLKVSIDGHEKADVSLVTPEKDFNFNAYSISGLTPKIHVLQVEPDDGWAVVDYIHVTSPSDMSSPSDGGAPADAGILFNSKEVSLAALNGIESRNNVEGFNPDIGPELVLGTLPADWGLSTLYAHTGDTAIRYSGSSTAGPAYCYMLAFVVKIPVSSNTWLDYWILPQQDNGRYVAVDLHCTDGSVLSTTNAVDQNNQPVAPSSGHGGSIPLDTWSLVRCHIGEWLEGKTVDKIWIGYARQIGAGQYRGYIDDLTLDNEKLSTK